MQVVNLLKQFTTFSRISKVFHLCIYLLTQLQINRTVYKTAIKLDSYTFMLQLSASFNSFCYTFHCFKGNCPTLRLIWSTAFINSLQLILTYFNSLSLHTSYWLKTLNISQTYFSLDKFSSIKL